MKVGAVWRYVPADLETGLTVSGEEARLFVIIVSNTSTVPDATESFTLSSAFETPESQANRQAALAPSRRAQSLQAATLTPTARRKADGHREPAAIQRRLRAFEREHLSSARLRGLRPRGNRSTRGAQFAIGDTVTRRVPKINSPNPCTDFVTVRAVVREVGFRSIVLTDIAAPLPGFSSEDIADIREEFDSQIFKTDSTYFGLPPDVDENERVELLITPRANSLSGKIGPLNAGFFFAGDLLSASGSESSSCAASNEGEILYLVAPKESEDLEQSLPPVFAREYLRVAQARELERLINAGLHAGRASRSADEEWLEEGLTDLASVMVGRLRCHASDLEIVANSVDCVFLLEANRARLGLWRSRPDIAGALSTRSDGLASRGAAWGLIRFAADHYSGGDVPRFLRCLIRASGDGAKRLAHCAGASTQRIMSDWLVAMAVDHFDFLPIDRRYQYVSWDMRAILLAHDDSTGDPFVIMQLVPIESEPVTTTTPSGSAAFFGLLTQSSDAKRRVFFRNANSFGPIDFPGAVVSVVRIW
jgi:hypothetical protein